MLRDAALRAAPQHEGITIARGGGPAKPGLWPFPVFVLFRPVIGGRNRASHVASPARISRLHPTAYGQRRGAGLWPAACFLLLFTGATAPRGAPALVPARAAHPYRARCRGGRGGARGSRGRWWRG